MPGRKKKLQAAQDQEDQVRAVYAQRQQELEETQRKERQLRIQLRREENDQPTGTWDLTGVPEVTVDLTVETEVEMDCQPQPTPQPQPTSQPQPMPTPQPTEKPEIPDAPGVPANVPVIPQQSEKEESDDGQRSEPTGEMEAEWVQKVKQDAQSVWAKVRKGWRILNDSDVDEGESLRIAILAQIDEIEEELKKLRGKAALLNPGSALRLYSELNGMSPKIMRLRNFVRTAEKENPQIQFPPIETLEADGFSLLDDVTTKQSRPDNTAEGIDRFLLTLAELRVKVENIPEPEDLKTPAGFVWASRDKRPWRKSAELTQEAANMSSQLQEFSDRLKAELKQSSDREAKLRDQLRQLAGDEDSQRVEQMSQINVELTEIEETAYVERGDLRQLRQSLLGFCRQLEEVDEETAMEIRLEPFLSRAKSICEAGEKERIGRRRWEDLQKAAATLGRRLQP